ncbi:MAG: hypothetical protein RSE57_06665 [Clostridia bacterium]
MLLIAIIDRYIAGIDFNAVSKTLGCKFKRTYYKLATIEVLKENKYPVILHQRLDVGLDIEDIEEIFSLSKSQVLIIPEKYRESSFVEELFVKKIYNVIFEDDVDSDIITNLLKQSRTKEEAREYLCIQ